MVEELFEESLFSDEWMALHHFVGRSLPLDIPCTCNKDGSEAEVHIGGQESLPDSKSTGEQFTKKPEQVLAELEHF